ncbi:hypothetical protein JCGZ_05525 [Jatropha curcas]|uniref:Uncharacterized protein n=1 Tax=Jatropha curcas TaxID=180498 RepID=A0A067L9Y8_JATCU|nr:vegetative cell wall protein gp1 [Jatropha curcas]KDP44058.1 hypothetical protein JCGZ_05525 [Jatropha curcas]
MATKFLVSAILAFLCIQIALSATPPESPSPSSDLEADSPSLSPPSPSPESGSPSLPPTDSPISSPPAPPPSDLLSPGSSPAPALSLENSTVPSPSPAPAPAPAPAEVSDINHSDNVEAGGEEEKGSSGMSGGKKAGIAVGVIVAAGVVGLGGLVYKKRQDNIRRSRYGSAAAATREFL